MLLTLGKGILTPGDASPIQTLLPPGENEVESKSIYKITTLKRISESQTQSNSESKSKLFFKVS
jgi:hypothetical protein